MRHRRKLLALVVCCSLVPAATRDCGAAPAAKTEPEFKPQIELANPATRFWHRRDFEFEVPKAGFYEILARFKGMPRQVELTLDGKFLMHHLSRTSFDPSCPKKYPFFSENTARVARYLEAGKHALTAAGYQGTYPFGKKEVDDFFNGTRIGLNPIPATDAAATLSVFVRDRGDLVMRKGEKLAVVVEKATDAAESFTMELVRQRGDGKSVWSGKAELPAKQARAAAEIAYNCPEEGAFEYVVKDAKGEVVDGPWAFVVVDPTPLR